MLPGAECPTYGLPMKWPLLVLGAIAVLFAIALAVTPVRDGQYDCGSVFNAAQPDTGFASGDIREIAVKMGCEDARDGRMTAVAIVGIGGAVALLVSGPKPSGK